MGRALTLLVCAVTACGRSGLDDLWPGGGGAGTGGGGTLCDRERCPVPLSEAAAVCPNNYDLAMTTCPDGTTAKFGPCAAGVNRVRIQREPGLAAVDCYYDAATFALVGAVLRSDASFTRVAGKVPGSCLEPRFVCDENDDAPLGTGLPTGTGGPTGAGATGGAAGGSSSSALDGPCRFVPEEFDPAGAEACPATPPTRGTCPHVNQTCFYPGDECHCVACRYWEHDLIYWNCRSHR